MEPKFVKHIVLVGGGHCHVNTLKTLGKNPVLGLRITLINNEAEATYSSMLPGYILGEFKKKECHIDLRKLANFAGARFFESRVETIDFEKKKIYCVGRSPVSYDLLSLNIGSDKFFPPNLSQNNSSIYPLRPLSVFFDSWQKIIKQVLGYKKKHVISVIGAGAAGIEIILSLQKRIQDELEQSKKINLGLTFQLITSGNQILSEQNGKTRSTIEKILEKRKIRVRLNSNVNCLDHEKIILDNGERIESNIIVLATKTIPLEWVKDLALEKDENGFPLVRPTLQSYSFSNVFIVGDTASFTNHPLAKSGVYAVRQSPILIKNIIAKLTNKPLQNYQPQRTFLSILNIGEKKAVLSYKNMILEGKIAWEIKKKIDQNYIKKFTDLSITGMPNEQKYPVVIKGAEVNQKVQEIMRCGGCSAKIGHEVLTNVFNRLKATGKKIQTYDDAYEYSSPTKKRGLQTVDSFRAMIDDPYMFGKITVYHCLNDIYAMGGKPAHALASVALPHQSSTTQEEELFQLLSGVVDSLESEKTILAGGHTAEGAELTLGLSITGFAFVTKIMRKLGACRGDSLVITKPLGSGVVLAGNMQNLAQGAWVTELMQKVMLVSNRRAAEIFQINQASSCTDISGFGLLGHLSEMMQGHRHLKCRLSLNSLPLSLGAQTLFQKGITSVMSPNNEKFAELLKKSDDFRKHRHFPILFDPQTSGALMATIPQENIDSCLQELNKSGYEQAKVIGVFEEKESEELLPIELIESL